MISTSTTVRTAAACLGVAFLFGAATTERALGRQQKDTGEIETVQVTPDVHMIAGAGGNIVVQIGSDGVVVVDTGSGERAVHVVAEIRKLTKLPIRYVINTSADNDHVGGNDEVSKAGQSIIPTGGLNEIGAAGGRAPILAEEHVQARMTAPHGEQAPFPVGAWPTVTFSSELQETQKDLYLNGQAIQVFYQPEAHTDGDSIVFFRRSDVLVTGDVFDQTRFPVIDVEKGGTVQGVINSLNKIIEIAVPPIPLTWQDGGTVVIPGHGWVSHEHDVVDYRDMVTIVRDRVREWKSKGMTLEQVQASDPAKGWRRRFGSDSGAWTTSMFVKAVYDTLK
jgi:cyclase